MDEAFSIDFFISDFLNNALTGGVASGAVASVQAAAAIIAARARKDLRKWSLQSHGNPTGMARTLSALASLALRPRL